MKSMKKSMVVTTVLMVLLLIVALSTATFAWYTAQSTAMVNETAVTSANSSSASLVIDEAKALISTATQSEVTITMTQEIKPAILKANDAPEKGVTSLTDFNSFMTYTVTNNGKYASVPASTDVAKINSVKGSSSSAQSQESFFVTNVGGMPADVEATVTINPYVKKDVAADASVAGLYTKSGETYTATGTDDVAVDGTDYYQKNEFLRVAMFIGDVYVGTWALDAYKDVQYYAFTATPAIGDDTAAHNNYTATVSGTAVNVKSSLAPMGAVEVKLLAWFEGDSHTNAYAGTGSLFSVSFNGATAA